MTSRLPDAPYLSIVATARNDDHGGDLLGRMQHFVDCLADQSDRHGLDAELVLVEWNPPGDRPGLDQALEWRHLSNRLQVRIVQVPRTLHDRFRCAAQLPLFQMIAKNVGVRRSLGTYVLATNIDILFSEELVAFLARRELRRGRMYRVDRFDIDPAPPTMRMPVAARIEWARSHTIRRHGMYESLDLRTGESFSVAWRPTWRVRLLEWLQRLHAVPVVTRLPLHLNGCGDFTLLHRDHWFQLRGYAELEMYSMHIDSLFCTAAAVAGVKEVVLPDPQRIYHIEHGKGSGFTPENAEALNTRLAQAGIPQLTHAEFNKMAIQMRRAGRPLDVNGEQWGLDEEVLPESSPPRAATRTESLSKASAAPTTATHAA